MIDIVDKKIRVRFAPSPTGHLHIGGLRTALFNWLFAKHGDGIYCLRIEDTDMERSSKEFEDSILQSFAWVDIQSDEPIVIQSKRLDEHKKILHALEQAGKIYRCYCTQEELTLRIQKTDELFVRYDRYCFGRVPLQAPYVFRFKLPDNFKEIGFDDIIRGRILFAGNQFDDFIITRSDGSPTYNFVVVIDDAFMRITHVIRGEEHINNTPKQILLYQACGYEVPQFAHLPMILSADGSKLSKRDGATSVIDYKYAGYLPQALINYLARLGWSYKDQEIFSRQELINYFSLDQVGKKGAIFDKEKLNWVNALYIRAMENKALIAYMRNELHVSFQDIVPLWQEKQLDQAVTLYKDRVQTLKELLYELELIHNGPSYFNEHDVQTTMTIDIVSNIQLLLCEIQQTSIVSSEQLVEFVKFFAKKNNCKLVTLAIPLRIALMGKASGPGLFALFALVSISEIIKRLEIFIKKVKA